MRWLEWFADSNCRTNRWFPSRCPMCCLVFSSGCPRCSQAVPASGLCINPVKGPTGGEQHGDHTPQHADPPGHLCALRCNPILAAPHDGRAGACFYAQLPAECCVVGGQVHVNSCSPTQETQLVVPARTTSRNTIMPSQSTSSSVTAESHT